VGFNNHLVKPAKPASLDKLLGVLQAAYAFTGQG
jgi:hypothetical protein